MFQKYNLIQGVARDYRLDQCCHRRITSKISLCLMRCAILPGDHKMILLGSPKVAVSVSVMTWSRSLIRITKSPFSATNWFSLL